MIVAVTRESPRILTISPAAADSGIVGRQSGGDDLNVLPYGPLDPEADRTLELTVRRWVLERTGLELGYVEQLYTFGDRDRAEGPGASPRVISVAYLALVREDRPTGPARPRWRDWYTFFPWEDWRAGQPEVIRSTIAPALDRWAEAGATHGPGRGQVTAGQTGKRGRGSALRRERRLRGEIAFGLGGSVWDADRVLERYELLYEIGLVSEAHRDQGGPGSDPPLPELGRPMEMDHRRILATGLGRLRGKLRYRPVVFELLPDTFTLLRLQRVVEALVGQRLHKQNFRRLVERGGLVEGTGKVDPTTGGRPAGLFRFRREVLRERRAAGVVVPGS